MIKVLLVEDDEVFRMGLTFALRQSSDINLVGVAIDGQSAIDLTKQHEPDVILMDLGLPVLNGMAATMEIKTSFPQIKILALTSNTEPKYVDDMMKAGADGFCLKGISTDRLVQLIHDVQQGIFWIDAAVSAQIKSRLTSTSNTSGPDDSVQIPTHILKLLTEREAKVLSLLAEGKKNAEIAEILCISPGTVRVHVHSILDKLNVRDRTQAALFVKQTPTS